jgi:hypothetical protein
MTSEKTVLSLVKGIGTLTKAHNLEAAKVLIRQLGQETTPSVNVAPMGKPEVKKRRKRRWFKKPENFKDSKGTKSRKVLQ